MDYVIGVAKNPRLIEKIGWELAGAQAEAARCGWPTHAGSPSSATLR